MQLRPKCGQILIGIFVHLVFEVGEERLPEQDESLLGAVRGQLFAQEGLELGHFQVAGNQVTSSPETPSEPAMRSIVIAIASVSTEPMPRKSPIGLAHPRPRELRGPARG